MYQAVIKRWPVYLVSACTFAIVIFRAVHQAVTIDEADTFLSFVHQALPMVWYPSPNNHVLNSISEAMSVHLFGVSPFSIRVPAVIGAGIYIGVCATFAIRFMDDSLRAVILLTVLTANPFIMDYLVAARGYSLALGFLVLTVYLLSKARTQAGSARLRSLAFGSASSGLAISANFSFAFAVACTLIVFGLVIVWDQKHKLAICVALFLPFITIPLLVCGPALTGAKRDEFFYGASSIFESIKSIVSASMDGPNRSIANPDIVGFFALLATVLPYVIALTVIIGIAQLLFLQKKNPTGSLSLTLYSIVAITLATHVVFSILIKLPLPLARTGTFIVPLFMLAIGANIAESKSLPFRRLTIAALGTLAIFFVFSVRVSFFREWLFDEHTDEAYSVVKQIVAENPGATIGTDWRYVAAMNFYEVADPNRIFPQIHNETVHATDVSPDRQIYILCPDEPNDEDYIKTHRLRIVFSYPYADVSNFTIAVIPGLRVPTIYAKEF